MTKNRKQKMASGIFVSGGLLLFFVSRNIHGFAQWYSEHIYPVFVGSMGKIAGIFSFSLAEILMYLLLVWIVASGILRVRRGHLCGWLWNVCLLASVLFFLYMMNCGVNYYRDSFAESSGSELEKYSVEELEEVCQWLTQEVNELGAQVERDEDGVMTLGVAESGVLSEKDILQEAGTQAVQAMTKLGKTYKGLSGYYPKPKGLKIPWILSVQQLSGIYSPFTIEANYNSAMVEYYIPFTMCHELSHLRGFMQEKEANFIGFLACRESEREEFRYSGSIIGWTYCMNVLYKADYEKWEVLYDSLTTQVKKDLQANREFWDTYDGTVAEVSNKVNDTYLKANGQTDGVESYDRMVDLIVAYYQKNF